MASASGAPRAVASIRSVHVIPSPSATLRVNSARKLRSECAGRPLAEFTLERSEGLGVTSGIARCSCVNGVTPKQYNVPTPLGPEIGRKSASSADKTCPVRLRQKNRDSRLRRAQGGTPPCNPLRCPALSVATSARWRSLRHNTVLRTHHKGFTLSGAGQAENQHRCYGRRAC